jgi:phytoene/squalene synthetase
VPESPKNLSKEDLFCYRKLPHVSRSFTAVIAEMSEELRRPVRLPHPVFVYFSCFSVNVVLTGLRLSQIANFYLVLRGLDTIEDDMSIPLEDKVCPSCSATCAWWRSHFPP